MNCPQSGQLARLFAECVAAFEKSEQQSDNAVTESFELLITPKMKEEARRRLNGQG
jgi:hypothetical protein